MATYSAVRFIKKFEVCIKGENIFIFPRCMVQLINVHVQFGIRKCSIIRLTSKITKIVPVVRSKSPVGRFLLPVDMVNLNDYLVFLVVHFLWFKHLYQCSFNSAALDGYLSSRYRVVTNDWYADLHSCTVATR